METLRFSLGVRFDFLTEPVSDELVDGLLKELCSAIPLDIAADLMIYGGKYNRSEFDHDCVYMVIFTKGCLKNMRKLYSTIDNDAVLHGMLCQRDPYLQNNVLRELDGFEYFGKVEADGHVRGGTEHSMVFAAKPAKRVKTDPNKKIIVAPNAFKGTFSSFEASKYICSALRKKMPCTRIEAIPVADGGDGTQQAVKSMLSGMVRTVDVTSPYGKKIKADYYSVDGEAAVIESALASGLAVCGDDQLDPLKATSMGTGELILRALHEGLKNIYICLGGSATNDCGIGALEALGFKFLDADGEAVSGADKLGEIVSIDDTNADPFIKSAVFTVVCDVENPLTGAGGATYTFGRQKGADDAALELLESGTVSFSKLLDKYAGRQVSAQKGAGAAGGMGAGFMALLKAGYSSGANMMLDIAEYEKRLKLAAVVITGEGCIDETSVRGKAPGVIAKRASACGVPCAFIAGKRGPGAEKAEQKAAFTVYCENGENRKAALANAAEKLADEIKSRFGLN